MTSQTFCFSEEIRIDMKINKTRRKASAFNPCEQRNGAWQYCEHRLIFAVDSCIYMGNSYVKEKLYINVWMNNNIVALSICIFSVMSLPEFISKHELSFHAFQFRYAENNTFSKLLNTRFSLYVFKFRFEKR